MLGAHNHSWATQGSSMYSSLVGKPVPFTFFKAHMDLYLCQEGFWVPLSHTFYSCTFRSVSNSGNCHCLGVLIKFKLSVDSQLFHSYYMHPLIYVWREREMEV